jgi:hypothetical protein
MSSPESGPVEIQKNKAFQMYFEWGPNSMIPRLERLSGAFNERSGAEVLSWIAEFDQVHKSIFEMAEKADKTQQTVEGFTASMQSKFPWLDSESCAFARALAIYYAIHEGFVW